MVVTRKLDKLMQAIGLELDPGERPIQKAFDEFIAGARFPVTEPVRDVMGTVFVSAVLSAFMLSLEPRNHGALKSELRHLRDDVSTAATDGGRLIEDSFEDMVSRTAPLMGHPLMRFVYMTGAVNVLAALFRDGVGPAERVEITVWLAAGLRAEGELTPKDKTH